MFALLETNVRVPDKVLGDLRAQIAAVKTGERGLIRLTDRYGTDSVRENMDALIDHSEQLAKEEIRAIPDGLYRSTGHIDADNVAEGPMVLQVAVKVSGDRVTVDFEGSSPQMKAGINSPLPFSKAAVYGALRLLMDPNIPNSAGYTRLIDVSAPEASVVNPVLPAACGARGITGFRIMDTVLGALAQAVPDKVPADGEGGNTIISIGGHAETGAFAYVDLFAGARGARPSGDGPDGVAHPAANISNTPVEIAEVETPVRIEEYGLLANSGGAGKYRGALSEVRSVRCLAQDALLQLRSDKRRYRPFGLEGGREGSPSNNILNPGDSETILTTMGTAPMRNGDLIRHELASGGGWGNPLERDPDMVLSDLLDEKISIDHAREIYGVIFINNGQSVDLKETEQLRKAMMSEEGV
jgi:N-methylhydantoinase B